MDGKQLQQLGLLGREAGLPRHLSEPSTPFLSLHREETHAPCTVNGCSDPTVVCSNPRSVIPATCPSAILIQYICICMYIRIDVCVCVCMCSYLSRDSGQIPDINNLRMENFIKVCRLRGCSPSQEARHGSRCPHGVQSVWLWQDSSRLTS